MTTQIKGYPFEVVISNSRTSIVLSDQIKILDWIARKATFKGKVTPIELSEIRKKASALIHG
jgi:mRNA interferase MazF